VWDEVREEVEVELEQLGELLASFGEFWDKPLTWRPSLVELAAIASVLHSFYNGAENILRRISIRVDGGLPSGEAWHTELLASMAGTTSLRGAVIAAEAHGALLRLESPPPY